MALDDKRYPHASSKHILRQVVTEPAKKGVVFLKRQPRDWLVTVFRSSIARLVYQMVLPYQSIYTKSLGATTTQLGIVNSAGMGVAGIISPFVGWLIDRLGIKGIYLFGIIMLMAAYLVYGIAQSWQIIIIAMAAYWMGNTTSIHGCATICANSLASEDRATGMAFCETLAAGALGIIGPMAGAWLVVKFGGINVDGIRPLFFLAAGGTLVAFFMVFKYLSGGCSVMKASDRIGFFKGVSQVFKEGRYLKRWLVITSFSSMPLGMVIPFSQVFAHEIKGAEEYVLGAMVTGTAMTSLLLGIPIGRLADRIGRKKVIYMTTTLVWTSSLMLIWAPHPAFLVLAGTLQGFFYIGGPVQAAMGFELVPSTQMGRWLGIIRFFRLLLSSGTAFLAGAIWDNIGPAYVFLSAIGIDLVFRIPCLISMPETLKKKGSSLS